MRCLLTLCLLLLALSASAENITWEWDWSFATDSTGAIEDDFDTVTAAFIDTSYSSDTISVAGWEAIGFNYEIFPGNIDITDEDTITFQLFTSNRVGMDADGHTTTWKSVPGGEIVVDVGADDTTGSLYYIINGDSVFNYLMVRQIYNVDDLPATMEDTAAGQTKQATTRIFLDRKYK